MKTTLTAIAIAAMFAASANAAITVDSVVSWDWNAGTANLDASGSDMLVVVVTGEHHFGNTGGSVNGVTYDGAAMTEVLDLNPVDSSDIQAISYFVLLNPATSTGLIDVTEGGKNYVYTALALSGAVGVGNTASRRDNGGDTVALATSGSSLVIGAISMGGDHTGGGGTGNTALINEPVVAGGLTVEDASLEIGTNWAGHVVGHGAGGAGAYGFTNPNNRPGVSITAVEILAPEPASMALLGLGGMLIVSRRRR